MPTNEAVAKVGMSFGRFVTLAVGTLVVLWGLGYWPTLRLAGEAGIPAMLVGGAVGLVASLVGTVPIVLSYGKDPSSKVPAVMGAIATRVGVAIVLALALALSRFWPVEPLLIWVAIAHTGLLIADTSYAKSHMNVAPAAKPGA